MNLIFKTICVVASFCSLQATLTEQDIQYLNNYFTEQFNKTLDSSAMPALEHQKNTCSQPDDLQSGLNDYQDYQLSLMDDQSAVNDIQDQVPNMQNEFVKSFGNFYALKSSAPVERSLSDFKQKLVTRCLTRPIHFSKMIKYAKPYSISYGMEKTHFEQISWEEAVQLPIDEWRLFVKIKDAKRPPIISIHQKDMLLSMICPLCDKQKRLIIKSGNNYIPLIHCNKKEIGVFHSERKGKALASSTFRNHLKQYHMIDSYNQKPVRSK